MNEKQVLMLHCAAVIIEVEGVGGYDAAKRLIGEEAANAMLVAHIRRNCDSMDTYPPRAEIISEVDRELVKAGILAK